jgi:hypothetical protein
MKEYGFAEICFQCDAWVTDKAKWRTHCQTHLDDIATLPFLFNPLTFRKTLAAAGQCPFCAFNPALDPEVRFKRFPYTQPWKEHINEHFTDLESEEQSCGGPDESKTFQCPDTRCGLSFDSVQDLRYHCHDSQGIDLTKFTPLKSRARGKKRSVEASSGPESKKRRIDFVNETVETLSSPDRLIPKDEAGGKPRRGRPRKQPAPISKGDSGVKMGTLRPLRRESSAALSSTAQGKRGRKKKRIQTPRHPQGLLVVQEAPRAVSRYLVPNWRVKNFNEILMMRLQVYPPGLQVYIMMLRRAWSLGMKLGVRAILNMSLWSQEARMGVIG